MDSLIAAPPYRLKVRIGQNEFEAEGSEESVRDQYSQFLEAVASVGQPASKVQTIGVLTGPAKTQIQDADFEAVESQWNRVFIRRDDQISLHVQPQTDERNADSLLLLIYGYHMLLHRDSVNSTELIEAARQSGLRIDRIDRNLPHTYNALIIKGGSGKGSRYSLSNPGRARAQELLDEMFG